MLGWEFPPFINGGLGVATAGLTRSLAEQARIRLILPKSDPAHVPDPVELIGLDRIRLPERWVQRTRVEYETLTEVDLAYVPVVLHGYERSFEAARPVATSRTFQIAREKTELERIQPPGRFVLSELYGHDLHDRVLQYGDWVQQLQQEQPCPDIIHAHDWMTFPAALELKARTGAPLVCHVHSLEYDRGGPASRGWVFELERHTLCQADQVLPVSAYTADILQRHYGVDADRITVVPNGIDPVSMSRQEAPFPEKLIVFLGRLTGQKGPRYFFEAARKLLHQRDDLRFVIAGKGHLIEELIEEAAIAGLGSRVHFTGFLEPDRVRALLSMADVYVMPSVSEPFGLSALEAAQMGVPVIISQQAGVREVLPAAIQVDYWHQAQLAGEIERLVDHPEQASQQVAAQFQNLKALSWEASAEKVMHVYRKLLS